MFYLGSVFQVKDFSQTRVDLCPNIYLNGCCQSLSTPPSFISFLNPPYISKYSLLVILFHDLSGCVICPAALANKSCKPSLFHIFQTQYTKNIYWLKSVKSQGKFPLAKVISPVNLKHSAYVHFLGKRRCSSHQGLKRIYNLNILRNDYL